MKQSLILIFLILSGVLFAQHPSIGGYNVYYGHLHNHTSVSDGTGTTTQAYTYARDSAHLDFFSLADHCMFFTSSSWSDYKTTAQSFNQDSVFVAFWGFEWSSNFTYGHVAVINTDDHTSSLYTGTTTFSGLCDWLSTREGVAFFNHPGRENSFDMEFNLFEPPVSEKFVGMELWNKSEGFTGFYYNDGYYENDGNLGYFDEALVRGWKIGATGSEDNHDATWGNGTESRMAVLSQHLTKSDIYTAFKARRFFSTLDKNIALSFKIDTFEMGSTTINGSKIFHIQATDGDGELFTKVQLFRKGFLFQTWEGLYPVIDISFEIPVYGNEYYYVKITQEDGQEAISSPIWVTGASNQPPFISIITPQNGATFYAEDSLTISATGNDSDGTISFVDFYFDGIFIGTDSSVQYQFTVNNLLTGNHWLFCKAADNAGAVSFSDTIYFTVQPDSGIIFIETPISIGNNDAEEILLGQIYLTSSDIELVYDSFVTGDQTVGLRFENTGLPNDATITRAYIRFTASDTNSDACDLVIKGEASDNATIFLSQTSDISSRITTSASVLWFPAAWNTVGASDSTHTTPDLSCIVQEIVSRPGFGNNSPLCFIITGSGTRSAYAYEGDPTKAAILHIEYVQSLHENKNKTNTTEFIIYPNPARNKLFIKANHFTEPCLVEIYNFSGQKVSTFSLIKNNQEIDLHRFNAGIYLLKIINSDDILYAYKIMLW